MAQEILWIIAGALVGAALIWLWQRGRTSPNNTQEKVLEFQQALAERVAHLSERLEWGLSQNVAATNESKSFLADRVSAAERTVRAVSQGLGKLEVATHTLQQTNQEIARFQDLLRSPKIRGGFGEVILAHLLADVLPHDRYKLQYAFTESGEIADAVIFLLDGYRVAIDAKFPLANFQAMAENPDKAEKSALRKAFVRDVKKHVAAISAKYISPQHKTLDYAFMYIPVEAVYYETVIHDTEGETLWGYCLEHHVIPVSPNSLLAYLQTVLVGLRGLKIQEQAKEILEALGQVRRDFSVFAKDFAMVGTHLTNAKNRFDDSARRLDKFTNRLDQIEGTPRALTTEPAAEESEKVVVRTN